MRYINAVTVSIVGIAVAALLAPIEVMWPAAVIGAGALVAAGLLLLGRANRKYYAAAGSIYAIGLAATIYNLERFPAEYGESPMAALVLFGLVSAFIVAAQLAGRRAVKSVAARVGGDKYATVIYEAIAAIVGLFAIVWTVLTAHEKAVRYGGLGVGTTGTFALNFLGAEFPVPVWFISGDIDATILLFVGCVVAGFHLLESIHTAWRAAKMTASAGASAGKSVGSKAASAADNVRSGAGEDP